MHDSDSLPTLIKDGGRMTPVGRIDAALDSVLRASGSALRHYTIPQTLQGMREAMRKIMKQSYIDGSNAAFSILQDKDD